MATEEDNPSYDGPETFRSLWADLADIEEYLTSSEISRIIWVSAFLVRMRQACADNVHLDVAELMQLLAALESIGARGWYQTSQGRKNYKREWLRSRKELEDQRLELVKAEDRNKKLEEERDDLSRQLSQVVGRLEPLADQLNQLHGVQLPLEGAPPPNRLRTLSDIDENNEEFKTYGSGWGTEDLPSTQEPKQLRRRRSSSNLTEVGDALYGSAISYPPPLAPATEEARKADERKTSMLSEVENTLWIQESKDREYLLKRPAPPPTVAQLPPSSRLEYRDPFYIYIPLPANFTIPQAQSHPQFPSLVFPTPPAVFHFPDGGTRDQLLDILRNGCAGGVGDEHLEPIEDINIIRVRTHEIEWELKNAIRKSMTEEDWEGIVGDDWSSEGRGDTYIVSKRDVHFVELSGGSKATYEQVGKTSQDSTHERVKKDADHEGRPEYCSTQTKGKGEEEECPPQMRGGGALSPLPSLSSSLSLETSDGNQSPRTPEDSNGNNPFASLQHNVPVEHLHAWMNQAHILQLQNVSHGRQINHLHEIIRDVEGTVEWQDEELARAHRHIRQLQQKLRDRSDETLAAGRTAAFARAETQLLKDQLQQIHTQVLAFCAELDDHEHRILSHYPNLSPTPSPPPAELRGGGDSPSSPAAASSTQPTEAHAFYFFPTISMLVLLSNPLHHFQFPAHTALPRVRQTLQDLHMQGRETDPHLRQVREIFDARDAAGIALPDTTNGRQVLISVPEVSDAEGRRPGFMGKWERSFGPTEYVYERRLKGSIESLEVPTAEEVSPTASVYAEKFHDTGVLVDTIVPLDVEKQEAFYNAGDLIDIIEQQAEVSRVRSAQDLANPTSTRRARGDSLGEKRGYDMALPLPPTELGPMFPTGTGEAISQEAHLTPQTVGTTGVKAWRLEPDLYSRPPPEAVRSPSEDLPRAVSKSSTLSSSPARLQHAPPTNLSSSCENQTPQPPSTRPRRRTEDGWGMWRHQRGEACEAWLDASKLDAQRTTCAFCGLPFAEKTWRVWEFDDGAGGG